MITLYIYLLSENIRRVVSGYWESVYSRGLTFESLENFAKFKNEAYRALTEHITRGKIILHAASTLNNRLLRPQPRTTTKKTSTELEFIAPAEEAVLYKQPTLVIGEEKNSSPKPTEQKSQTEKAGEKMNKETSFLTINKERAVSCRRMLCSIPAELRVLDGSIVILG